MSREDDAEQAEDLVDYIGRRLHCWERRALIVFWLCCWLIFFLAVTYVVSKVGLML